MTDIEPQGSPGSDSGYSAGASSEAGIEEALERLKVDDFTPDQHVEIPDSASTTSSGAMSQSSDPSETDSVTSQEDDPSKQTLDIWRKDPKKVEDERAKKKKENEKKKSFLHKIISKDKLKKQHLPIVDFSKIRVESLPQVFLAKYLGKRPTTALYGVKHTRRHVEDMVKVATKLPPGAELPLVILHVSKKGMRITEHKQNQNKAFEGGLVPIEYISYGVQDVKFFRIFSMIVVRQMSSRKKECECHAWACDSPISARKLALSISMAFSEFSKSVTDIKSTVFKVDLRTPETVAQDIDDGECDA